MGTVLSQLTARLTCIRTHYKYDTVITFSYNPHQSSGTHPNGHQRNANLQPRRMSSSSSQSTPNTSRNVTENDSLLSNDDWSLESIQEKIRSDPLTGCAREAFLWGIATGTVDRSPEQFFNRAKLHDTCKHLNMYSYF